MNNEELAMSLRTETNTYLKNTVADLQQEIAEIQDRVNAEIERHRGELEKSFQDLFAKGSAVSVDDNFARVVTDHLQMAFEDGSKEAGESAAADANSRRDEAEKRLAEAETRVSELEGQLADAEKNAAENHQAADGFVSSPSAAAAPADYAATRDAINEISSQTSQAEILKSLVKHASSLAPRGAFFIVKSDHLVGWRVFGREITSGGDEQVREVFLPVSGDTLLGKSIRENSVQTAASGDHAEDAQYLQKLNFGAPAQMTAIPLVVRGRGVAVLYADAGENGSSLKAEALESLVRVASLTVELLAAAKSSATKPPAVGGGVGVNNAPTQTAAPATSSGDFSTREMSFGSSPSAQTAGFDVPPHADSVEPGNYEERNGNLSESRAADVAYESFDKPSESFSFDNSSDHSSSAVQESVIDQNLASFSNDFSVSPEVQTSGETGFSFETTVPSYDSPASSEAELDHSQSVAAPRRYNERNSELPIDVPEDERRLHNDARRFARLLVSEVKLYNEQKVKEGRQARDLYSRLREAVERSREMYDKRVAPPVAARFDYFHYELVNTLAEGDENKLGESYPGASV